LIEPLAKDNSAKQKADKSAKQKADKSAKQKADNSAKQKADKSNPSKEWAFDKLTKNFVKKEQVC
jgi:hypothetical protein